MKHLMRQSVTFYDTQTKNAYGEISWSSSTNHKCRVQRDNIIIIDENGEQQQADIVVYAPSALSVDVGDRFDYNSTSYRILKLYETVDDKGATHHYKIIGKKWNVS